MSERAYPVGHPAASDYNGEPYIDPHAVFAHDYPASHPARGGKNCAKTDSPDGVRAVANGYSQDLADLAAMGSLPPLLDPDTHEPVELTADELALVYAVRNRISPKRAAAVTAHYGLEPAKHTEEMAAGSTLSAEDQALLIIVRRGYTPERAKELLSKYGVPDTLLEAERDAHR